MYGAYVPNQKFYSVIILELRDVMKIGKNQAD